MIRNLRKSVMTSTALAGLVALPATLAHAGPPNEGAWTFGLRGGAEFVVDGNVHDGVDAPIANLGALNPALDGVAATLAIESRDWDDVYGTMYGIGGEIGYGLSNSAEVFLSFSHTRAGGDTLQVGNAIVPALDASLPVFGDFDKFKAYAIEAGYRHHFNEGSGFRPFVGARAGVEFVNSIGATFTVPDADITLANVRFFKSSTILTGGIDVGFNFAVSDMVTVGLETGIYYASGLSDDDTDIGGLGLASINDAGKRISIPAMASIRISF